MPPAGTQMSTTGNPSPGERRALVVGVNEAPRSGQAPLATAARSALALATALQEHGSFALVGGGPLLNEQATTERVRQALYALLQDARPQDLLLFCFCGHGVPWLLPTEQREVYLATHDFDPAVLPFDQRAHLSLSWLREMLLDTPEVQAGTVMVLLDCCHAGQATTQAQREAQPLEGLTQAVRHLWHAALGGEERPQRGARIVLAATSAQGTTQEQRAQGWTQLVSALLPALRGARPDLLDAQGQLTYERLVDDLRQRLPGLTTEATGQGRVVLATFHQGDQAVQQATPTALREYARHPFSEAWLQERVQQVVGREQELQALCQRIERLRSTGGYLVVTGVAGQGKSSLLARLVTTFPCEQEGGQPAAWTVLAHFIPPQPGPGYQDILLRHLVALLLLRSGLEPFSVEHEPLAGLQLALRRLLEQVVKRTGPVLCCLDGLDQLPEDSAGRVVLPLPEGGEPVPGVVFVLGTRPSLLPVLQRYEPLEVYALPALSRPDWQRLLHQRLAAHSGIRRALTPELSEQLYLHMEGTPLFLDLAARLLAASGSDELSPAALARRVAANPHQLFSLALDQWGRRHPGAQTRWGRVIQPLLGILLVAAEPLERRQLKALVQLWQRHEGGGRSIDGQELKMGLEQLGGVLVEERVDGVISYRLYHEKFREYLRRDPDQPERDYLFDEEDEQRWHALLAAWCEEEGLARIWQESLERSEQRRRHYARRHYVWHLFQAGPLQWGRLLALLDAGHYGQEKVRWEVSGQQYAQDLVLGQRVAASAGESAEGLQRLPALWRSTLLRASLSGIADRYPLEAFSLMAALGQESKALGLAALRSDPGEQARAWLAIAQWWTREPGRASEVLQLGYRVQQTAQRIESDESRTQVMEELVRVLLEAQCYQEAEEVSRAMGDSCLRAETLEALAKALRQAQREEEAARVEEMSRALSDRLSRSWDLLNLKKALARMHRTEEATQAQHETEEGSRSAPDRFGQAGVLLQARRYQEAERVIRALPDRFGQARALTRLAETLARGSSLEEARRIWQEAEGMVRASEASFRRARALIDLAEALALAQRTEEAEQVWRAAEDMSQALADGFWRARAQAELAAARARIQAPQETAQAMHLGKHCQEVALVRRLGELLTEGQRFQETAEAIRAHRDHGLQAALWRQLGEALVRADAAAHGFLALLQRAWLEARGEPDALARFSLVTPLVVRSPELGLALFEAFGWVDRFLQHAL
jgi:hypothetical protein